MGVIKPKITDPDLASFLRGETDEKRRSVIAEIGPIRLISPKKHSGTGKRKAAIKSTSAKKDSLDAMEEFEAALRGVELSKPPVRLDASRAFVIDVTPEQLRTLTDNKAVARILPNRAHRIGSQSIGTKQRLA